MSTQEAQIQVAEQTALFLRALTLSPTFEVHDAATARLREENLRLAALKRQQVEPELPMSANAHAA